MHSKVELDENCKSSKRVLMHNINTRHISMEQQYLKGHDRLIGVATLHQPQPGLGPPLGPNFTSSRN